MKYLHGILCATALVAGTAMAGSPLRVPVHFAITNDAGLGYEWFVVGGHPDIGSWDPAHAVKLVWSDGNVWWGDVGVQAGTALQYKFVKRLTAADQIGNSDNAIWWPDGPDNLQTNVPAEPAAPFSGKTVEFYSDMTNVDLVFSTLSAADFGATGTWNTVAMTLAGPGLRAGEWRHVAEGVGTEGEWIRFTFNGLRNGADTWEGAWDGNDYWTPLDRLVVRDRQIFNYLPPSNGVSASHIITNYVGSSVSHVTGRNVRVYFPRGYAENVDRRYPVVYMSDGENVFVPGGTFGCWYADTTADAEIKGGRMREAIIVGVPSAANRQTEYLPHMDTDPDRPGAVGRANYYADYLLHNVRPMVDFNYRTKNDRANTACIGSSSGGLLATYLGTWTNAFGLVGAMSGVYSADFCPNFRTWLESARPHDARFWMDVGNVGGELNIGGISLYNDNFDLYWYLMGFGYVPNADLRFMIGIGHDHNEAAWAARLPYAYRFLLDVREEPNPLLAPEMAAAESARQLTFPVFAGTAYAIEKSDALTDGWTPATNWARETRPWGRRTVDVETLGGEGFFRVQGQ